MSTKYLKNFIIILISFFISILLLEIFSRNFIQKVPSNFFYYDPKALVWDTDSKTVAFKKPSKSIMTNGHFNEDIFINKDGFRVNYSEELIVNPQIITIGDSQTFGHGIPNDASWPNLLKETTGLSLGNLGVWGYRMQNYDYIIEGIIKNFKPNYLIYGMTDNDLCSFETPFTFETEYKNFIDMQDYNHFQAILKSPLEYFKNFTSLGVMMRSLYQNIFYRTSSGISPRSEFFKKTSRNLYNKCTKPTINWLNAKAILLKKYNIKMIVINIPHPRRVMALANGHHQENYQESIRLIKQSQKNNSLFYLIDPITELATHYKNNDYKRGSIILPVDTHYNKFSNNILSNLIKQKIDNLD